MGKFESIISFSSMVFRNQLTRLAVNLSSIDESFMGEQVAYQILMNSVNTVYSKLECCS